MDLKAPRKYWIFFSFLACYFLLAGIFNQFHDVWWDEASYLGMGKYIYSSGSIGVFEPVKAIGLPLIFGFGWRIGLDIIIFSKIIIFLSAFFSLLFVYLIGKEVFDSKTGIFASLLLLFNALFLVFMFRAYTEIPSICLFLGGVYFLKKYSFLSALFLALLCMVKYTNVFALIPVNLYLIYHCYKNKEIMPFISFNLFFLLFASPFFIANYVVFDSPLYLVNQLQDSFSRDLGSVYSFEAYPLPKLFFESSIWIYLKTIFYLFNFSLPFIFIGAGKLLKDYKKFILIVISAIIFLGFFEMNYLKQERYIMIAFPFLSLLAGWQLSKMKDKIAYIILGLFILINLGIAIYNLSVMSGEQSYYAFFMNSNISCNNVSTSDPRTALNYRTNFPYELFDSRWEEKWILKDNPECIFFFSCYERRGEIIKRLNELGYKNEIEKNTGRCLYSVFKNSIMEHRNQ